MAEVTKRPLYSKMNGIIYPAMFSSKCFKEALDYKAKPGETFIITYPKCGTTWMQNVSLFIFRKGMELEYPAEVLRFSPYLDMMGEEGVVKMQKPGAIKSHLPYTHMPYNPQSKYIFVTRNPKDCCVSFFHHAKMISGFCYWDGVFDEFFELFLAGEVEYNDYFDHLLSWYPHRNDKNVFYTTYESMKKDIVDVVLRLAKFLGKEYIDAIEKDNAILNNIVTFSGFEYMKKNVSRMYDMELKLEGIEHIRKFMASLDIPENLPQKEFIRKGIVGDYKNYFSKEQTERLNQKFLTKFRNTDILKWFN